MNVILFLVDVYITCVWSIYASFLKYFKIMSKIGIWNGYVSFLYNWYLEWLC